MFIISSKYVVGEIYRQSNKKELDQFNEWLNIQENNINSGVGNAQSIAPAYYIHRNLNIFMSNEEKIPAYLVLIDNHKYDNFMKNNFIYHWGDSKAKNNSKSADDFNGNKIFKLIHKLKSLGNIELIPPILYFDKPESGKLIFKGLCVLEELFLVDDFKDNGKVVPNYLAKLKITEDKEVELNYLHQRAKATNIDDLLVHIPKGLIKEFEEQKNATMNNHIKKLTLSDCLKIKGGLMSEEKDLQEKIAEEENTYDTNDSNDKSTPKNVSYWLFALDSLANQISTIDTNREISYQVSYSSNLDTDINPQKNDFIIGYISNPSSTKLLKYVFKITNVLDNVENSENPTDISISFEKLFETSIDIDVNSILDKAPTTYNSITSTSEINRLVSKIPYDEFNALVKFMLESLSSSIFDITLDIDKEIDDVRESNIFDITDNIEEKDLNDIEEDQKDLENEIRNRIVYGAPGTGKSHYINSFLVGSSNQKAMFKNEYLFERVTFHPAYTYGQFVGAYKPSPIYSKDDADKISWYDADGTKNDKLMNPHIDYKLVAGPFLNMLCKALNNPRYKFLLIIEEMNRANAAAVFGDVFQLLDRNDNNNSTYSIKFNADITNFLMKNVHESVSEKLFNRSTGFVRIPENLFIWGTMNSADEGVSKMDAAFKRRWSFKYTDINPPSNSDTANKLNSLAMHMPFMEENNNKVYIKWNKFRKKLNNVLYKISPNLPEDKYIGPFFLKDAELLDSDIIKSKLLLYLKDDVLRHSSGDLFKDSRFSEICKNFEVENIFKPVELDNDKLINFKIDKSEYANYINLENLDIHDDSEE